MNKVHKHAHKNTSYYYATQATTKEEQYNLMTTTTPTIFNREKTLEEYSQKKLFLHSDKGFINTIHKHHPRIWALYKEMKSLDWDENEFNYGACLHDFKTAAPEVSSAMISTIGFQWGADSIVSTSPVCLIAPFNPCVEVWETEVAITANELVHANTYSEIVRMSFDNPDEVLSAILSDQKALDRTGTIDEFMQEFAEVSRNMTNGVDYSEEQLVEYIMLYYYALLLLERIQFMASFAITFTICKSGLFSAIGQAVKKIAQDELEVHCEYRKEVIKELRNAFPGVFEKAKFKMVEMFKDVIETEMNWTEHLFKNSSIVGLNESIVKQWVLFNAKEVAKFSDIVSNTGFEFPSKNPIPHLEDWFNMNKTQTAPQEQDNPAYKVNIVARDDENTTFFDF